MKMLHLKSTFPVDHDIYSPDCFISIPHIIAIKLNKEETDNEKEYYYEIKIFLEAEFIAYESHLTEDIAKESLRNMLLKINHSSRAHFDYEAIDNINL